MKKPHSSDFTQRGISFGTIFMACVTVVVVGMATVIFPQLLGSADLNIDVGTVFSALILDGAMPTLALSDIPITDATPVPESSASVQQQVTPSPTPQPTPVPVKGGTVTLTIGGSVNIDDAIRKSAYYSDSGKYDFIEIMMLLEPEMQSDLTLVTLENIAFDGQKVSAVNAPSAVMDMLWEAGVDIVALGYPKACDLGLDGVLATIEAVQSRGMSTLGLYGNQVDRDSIRMFTVNNVDIAFLHYTETVSNVGKKAIRNDGMDYALPMTLVNGSPEMMLYDIRRAREQGADIIVVSVNWGTVSASKPTASQKELAQQMADAGADIIVGAGSRVVQPITWLTSKDGNGNIRHTLCAWSLGSLINESRKDGNVPGMLLQLQISFDGDTVSFEKVCYTPTYIWRYKQDGQYYYRIAVSDQPAPDGMGDDQAEYMAKALRNLQKYLGDSPVTLRER
ncbi:MAG: CapA family protein [Clostridia bacterium]|nr:CapA family protein [Clostridia bacterium]